MKKENNLVNFVKLFIISLTASVFARLFIDFISGISTAFIAYDFDINSYFNLSGIHFITKETSPLWYFDSQVSILLTKPIVSLFTGFFALAGLKIIKRKLTSFFFLLFWINIYAFNNSAGIIIDDIIAKTGVYNVSVLFKFNTEVTIITAIVFSYILYQIGIVNSLTFRTTLNRIFTNNKKTYYVLFVVSVILPWLINFSFPLFEKTIKNALPVILQNTSIFILFIPFFIYYPKKKINTKAETITEINSPDWINVVAFILGAALLYFVMNKGVYLYAE